MSSIKISVILAVRDNVNTIAQAIDSVLSQSYRNFEIIVQDGLSTDGTLEILKSYGTKIRLISEKDQGTSDAFLKALQRASGDFVTFLNADDFFASSFVFDEAVKVISGNPTYDLILSDILILDESAKNRFFVKKSRPFWMFWNMSVNMPGSFIRRKLFEKRTFDPRFKIANDYDLYNYWIRILKVKMCQVPKVWVHFRLGGMSTQIDKAELICKEDQLIREKYFGPIVATFVNFLSKFIFVARSLGFRPFFWLRKVQKKSFNI